MAPEPEPFADLMRDSLKRIADGHDVGAVLIDAIREGYARGRRDESEGEPFDPDEQTPTVDLWAQHDGPQPTRPVRPRRAR